MIFKIFSIFFAITNLIEAQNFAPLSRDLPPSMAIIYVDNVVLLSDKDIYENCCVFNCVVAGCRARHDFTMIRPNIFAFEQNLQWPHTFDVHINYSTDFRVDYFRFQDCYIMEYRLYRRVRGNPLLGYQNLDKCIQFFPYYGLAYWEELDDRGAAKPMYYVKYICNGLSGLNCRIPCDADENHVCDQITGDKICRINKFGLNCELDLHPCSTNICQNGGRCVRISTQFQCICTEQFTGLTCEIPRCYYKNCVHGLCLNDMKCICSNDYQGPQCSQRVCLPSTCNGRGSCTVIGVGPGVSCSCNLVSAGEFCQYSCPGACLNGGECVQLENTGYCQCTPGWTGPVCDIESTEIGACASIRCLNGGRCISEDGGFRCLCNEFWTGDLCEISQCNVRTCFNGVCIVGVGCQCLEGYVGATCDTPQCQDNNMCKNGGVCRDDRSAIYCECDKERFTGGYCELRCPTPCRNNGECIMLSGILQCSCADGFTGASCNDILPFTLCTNNPCQNKGECSITEGGYECDCPDGWTGRNCDLPSCTVANCIYGVCIRGSRCICKEGYRGNNCSVPTCQLLTERCSQYECGIVAERAVCMCDKSISTGIFCQFNCKQRCENRGECQLVNGSPSCVCDIGYYGNTCNTSREFLSQEIACTVIFALSICFIIIGAVMSVLLNKHKSRILQRALKNAMFDPSSALNLEAIPNIPEANDTYADSDVQAQKKLMEVETKGTSHSHRKHRSHRSHRTNPQKPEDNYLF